ncbi:MAG: apolipoprotein N-acyltransferase [Gammaproteobacteria bacterium]|nr:apolipoprotein N-acyltransferase [Gammaproteobacteria bacterium]
MPLAFAPFEYWILSIISVAGLILLWQQQQSSKYLFTTGFFFGLGYFGVGISWVYFSLHDFGNAHPIVAAGITVLLILWQSLYIALLGLAYAKLLTKFSKSSALLILPVLWFSMEWLKGIVMTGFPWLSLGYSHVSSPLSPWGSWIGAYAISSLSVLYSAAVAVLLTRQLKQNKWLLVLASVLVVLTAVITNIEQTSAQEKSLKITQIQGNIAQEIKWQRNKRQHILDVYWDKTNQHWDSDLIVWPETAIPGRSELIEESVLLPMSMLATEKQTNILFGVLVSDLAKSQYYNSMLMVGENQGMYHKRHLVPFGEYMPFRNILDFLNQYISIPMSDMQSGENQQPLMSVANVKLGVSICYEDVFSRDINQDLPEANILINTSNDAWFGDSLAPHQHLQIAQMRAIETGRPMVRSTNTGISAFINHKGAILKQTQQFQVETLTANVTGRTGQTAFVLIEPYQWLFVVLTSLVFLRRRQNI